MIQSKHKRDNSLQETLIMDLTPMLDVLFLLLIFFVLTANVAQFSIDLTLPSAEQSGIPKEIKPDALLLTMHINPKRWVIDDKTYNSWDEAKTALQKIAAQSPRPLTIAGDKNLPLQRLIKVLTFMETIGLDAAEILVEPNLKTR